MDLGEAVGAEPLHVRPGLRGPFGVGEAGAEHPAVDDGGPVGGVHHVGQAGPRVEQFHGVAERAVAVVQVLPLGDGSTGLAGSIHGLMEYVAPKCVGGHIR